MMKNHNSNVVTALTDEKNIDRLFQSIGIKDYKIENISIELTSKDRVGLIVSTTDKLTNTSECIYVDAKSGAPNWDQMMDATFNIGSECSIRLILASDVYVTDEIYSENFNSETAIRFVHLNNDCGKNTILVNIVSGTDPESNEYEYEVLIQPENEFRTRYRELPSKQDFDRAEFNIYFADYYNRIRCEESDIHPDSWFDCCELHNYSDVEFAFPIWNENGLFMEFRAASTMGASALDWLQTTHSNTLNNIYQGYEIKTISTSPSSRIVSVKIWDKPLSEFTSATEEIKKKYFEQIRDMSYPCTIWIHEVMGKLPSSISQKAS